MKTISRALFVSVICFISTNVVAETRNDHELVERLPEKIVLRPGIMPTGIIQIDTSAKMTGLKAINLRIDTMFGIVRNLQGEFGYDGLDFNPFHAKRTVNLGAKYEFAAIPHVSFSATARLPIHIWDGEIVREITLGLPTVFYNDLMAGGILGDLFKLTMRPKIALEFNFPFWYGIQFYGNWWASVKSSFGNIKMDENKVWKAKGIWQELPAELSVTYAFNHFVDLGGFFGFDDVLLGKEKMLFGLTLSVRGGRLFG